jgi:hypothetical protein
LCTCSFIQLVVHQYTLHIMSASKRIRQQKFIEDRVGESFYKTLKRSPFHDAAMYVATTLKKRMPESMWLEESTKMPSFWLYLSATLFHIVLVSFIVYFGFTTFFLARKDTFVSLSQDSGECILVPRSVSGDYSATYQGVWSSDPKFTYNYSSYVTTLDNFNRK